MQDRIMRPGMLVYIAGIIVYLVAIFTPYIRYKFTHELYSEAKGSYSLVGINGITDDFFGIDNPGLLLKLVPVLLILAALAGIICCIMKLADVNVSSFIAFIAPTLAVIAYLIVKFNSAIKAVVESIKSMEDSLSYQGYSGNGGYGIGAVLLIISIVAMIVGAVLICVDE